MALRLVAFNFFERALKKNINFKFCYAVPLTNFTLAQTRILDHWRGDRAADLCRKGKVKMVKLFLQKEKFKSQSC